MPKNGNIHAYQMLIEWSAYIYSQDLQLKIREYKLIILLFSHKFFTFCQISIFIAIHLQW